MPPHNTPYPPLQPFEAYFSVDRIVRALATIRAREGQKEHNQHFFRRLGSATAAPRAEHRVFGMLPPRSLWPRAGLPRRKRSSSMEQNARMCHIAAMAALARPVEQDAAWCTRLRAFVATLRECALAAKGGKPRLNAPRVVAVAKEKGGTKYRPIAIFELEDRVLVGLGNQYLRDCFDPDLSPASYAFRHPVVELSHHAAFEGLRDFRAQHHGAELWVAECDIRAFYDVVSHDVALLAFGRAKQRAALRGVAVDPRAEALFGSYLRAYSFPNAREATRSFLTGAVPPGELAWPEAELKSLYAGEVPARIGVPQGGAISCLIANLVLDEADRAVAEAAGANPVFYARYCDDMIVVTASESAATAIYAVYENSLVASKLPAHPASPALPKYDAAHWAPSVKSRAAYAWRAPVSKDAVPWVSFVGYQVRFDGLTRIRPKSIAKELRKQVDVADSALRTVLGRKSERGNAANRVAVRVNRRRFLHRLRQRLRSMSVGAPDHRRPSTDQPLCWATGFRGLRNTTIVRAQLRLLDRGRERQIARVARAIADLTPTETLPPPAGAAPEFQGRPYSYDAAIPAPRQQACGTATAASTVADSHVDGEAGEASFPGSGALPPPRPHSPEGGDGRSDADGGSIAGGDSPARGFDE